MMKLVGMMGTAMMPQAAAVEQPNDMQKEMKTIKSESPSRLEELKKQILSGNYPINLDGVAKAIADEFL
ncbi:MAG: flagellar biosynthesis anti-sigma factor FlgM [Campylobacterales bacterium]